MVIIETITSIGYQDTFRVKNIWEKIKPLDEKSMLIEPDYKEFIPVNTLRRLSPVLKIALTAAKYCQEEVKQNFGAISVGTALGCLKDTEKFLQTYIQSNSDSISPTSFIQSTHNTIAGAISIALNNHSYNMTHTQNSLSFDTALLDATICIREMKKFVLLGAADEKVDFLNEIKNEVLPCANRPLTTGATFLVLSDDYKNRKGKKCIHSQTIDYYNSDTLKSINDFLSSNNTPIENISLLLYAGEIPDLAIEKKVNYEDYSGFYLTSSAFAFHMAVDYKLDRDKYVLIVNHQIKGKLALYLIRNAY